MLKHSCKINSRVHQRVQWHRLHHRQVQAQRLARLTRLSSQRCLWTVWPMNAEYACEKISGLGGCYKSATGEMVEGQGRFRVRCQSVWGHLLLSAETSRIKDAHSGWTLVTSFRKTRQFWQQCTRVFRVCEQHSWNGAIDLTKERGLYNLYVQVAGGDGNIGQGSWCQSQWNGGGWVRPSCIGRPSAGESVRLKELCVPSDGGEGGNCGESATSACEADRQSRDEHHDTGHAAYRSCDNFGVRVQTHWVLGCDTGAGEGMNVYALAFFTRWLRGLGWKRLLLRSDNERALLAFLRAAAASFGRCWSYRTNEPRRDHAANGFAEVGVRQGTDSSAENTSGRETRETTGLEWTTCNVVGSTLSELLVEEQNSKWWENAWSTTHRKALEASSCWICRKSSISTGRRTSWRSSGRWCGETDGWNLRWSSRAHRRIVVLFGAWIAERYESSAENRRPTVGQWVRPKMSRCSADAHRRRAWGGPPPMLASGDAYTWGNNQNATTEVQAHSEAGCGAVRTDTKMRGFYNSGRRSAESDEAIFRRMQGTYGRAHAAWRRHLCSSDCTQTVRRARQFSKRAEMSEEIQSLKWLDRVYRRGAAEKHLVAKAHENPREQERRQRGVVEKLSS